MSKDDKNRCKDVGGFVAGYLKGGKRNNASVVNRCAVCLDADYADPGLLDDLDMTFINAYAPTREYIHALVQKLTGRSPFKGQHDELVWCDRWEARL